MPFSVGALWLSAESAESAEVIGKSSLVGYGKRLVAGAYPRLGLVA